MKKVEKQQNTVKNPCIRTFALQLYFQNSYNSPVLMALQEENLGKNENNLQQPKCTP